MIEQSAQSSFSFASKFGRSWDSYRAVLDSGSSSAIFFAPPPAFAVDVAAEPPLEPLSLLTSLPQAATPNVRAAAATTETHFELRMESTLLLEVQGTGTGERSVHAWAS